MQVTNPPNDAIRRSQRKALRHVYLVFSRYFPGQAHTGAHHAQGGLSGFVFLSTFRPCCGFTLLLCAMIASFAAISDRVILAELEGTLVFPFSDSLWVLSGLLSHLLSVRRFGCDGGSDSLFLVSSSLFPLLFLCLFFCLAFSHRTS